jgi:hypothetical protein
MTAGELRKRISGCVMALALFQPAFTQDIPLGTWRAHLSFTEIRSVALGQNEVFAAAQNGVMVYHKGDGQVDVLHKGNGITGTGISRIEYDLSRAQLLIAYDDGTFDVICGETIRNIDPSRNTVLTGPRKINAITIAGAAAYLSTDYGVIIFDLVKREIKETWRDIGKDGSTVSVSDATILGDSIFLATESGIIAGALNDNLLDFNKWKRFEQAFQLTPDRITTFNEMLYASAPGSGIFRYDDGKWEKADQFGDLTFSSMTGSPEYLAATEGQNVWLMNTMGNVQVLPSPIAKSLIEVRVDEAGKVWLGDIGSGLVTNFQGTFQSIGPNGPSRNEVYSLTYHDNKIYAVSGGYSPFFQPLGIPGELNVFSNGMWSRELLPINDVTSVEFTPGGVRYASSFGFGLLETKGGSDVLFTESNSTLVNTNPPGNFVTVSDITTSIDGVWVANFGASPPLHLLQPDGSWSSYSFPVAASIYPVKLLSDFAGNVWMMLAPAQGGGLIVFNKKSNEHKHITIQDNQGELPSNNVYSFASDRDGYVWVGTDAGVAYFYDWRRDAVKPLFQNRFLLRDEKVKAIAIDGGNRKWMGTERGVWLFSPNGEEAIANFTSKNSPLLSDNIIDIEIHPVTGEVFFATDKGTCSYRADATAGAQSFSAIRIFPNPVTPSFTGQVGITGLATDAVVKITDVAGTLIWQTQANGGTASWDVRDHHGRRVRTGVFLVFAVAPDGSESVAGKIIVVN